MTEARTPAHVGLGCEESKSLMSRHQETVAKLGASNSAVIVGLVVKITLCSGSDYIAPFADRVPVFARRSSRRRCLSSQ